MVVQERVIELIPSAPKLINSLRHLGYQFDTAVADIVDNSIAARATTVAVHVVFAGDDSFVSIADNGQGMDADTLTAAMRYGSERVYSEVDLGRFGLGLKTASMSQCRRLTVASRRDTPHSQIVVRQWDLEHIARTAAWELLAPRHDECPQQLLEPLEQGNGTVVLWERLDRILGYRTPSGEPARRWLAQMCRELETHLAMVFHRFLSGEAKGRILDIYINGNRVEPWDPFARSEPRTQRLDAKAIPIEYEDVTGTVTLHPYVLPHQARFTTSQAFARASGPKKWNRQQGLYIYRCDRMIQSGGWSGLRTMDEHTKLARIALDFETKLDPAFKINVAKMRVQLPPEIRSDIEATTSHVIEVAQKEYRDSAKEGEDLGWRSGKGAQAHTYTLRELHQLLMRVADGSERQVLNRLFDRLTPLAIAELARSDGSHPL